jgi:site-specific recombinase XerD
MDKQTPIREVIRLCLEHASNSRSECTTYQYGVGLRRFLAFLESENISDHHPISAVTIEHFIRFPAWLSSNGYKKRTAGNYVSSMNYLLNRLVVNGILSPSFEENQRQKDAVSDIYVRREQLLPRLPERGVVERMLEAARTIDTKSPIKERNIALLQFLASSGCRISEALSLYIKDIDLDSKKAKVMGKGRKERIIFFDESTKEALEAYFVARKFRGRSHPVFARHDNRVKKDKKPMSAVAAREWFSNIMTHAGIDKGSLSPHYFRHGFAMDIYKKTKDLVLVQDLLGHSSPVSTRVYAKLYPDDMERAYREAKDKDEGTV